MNWWALAPCLCCAAVCGAQEATYAVRGSQLPVPVAANGYVQTVGGGSAGEVIVHVATSRAPVGSDGRYGGVRSVSGATVPAGFSIPRTLRTRLQPWGESWEVATEILEWVAAHVRLDDRMLPQDAASVLERRRGRCSGIANLTAALLLAAGFEARTVSGLLMDEFGAQPHRWVECRLPGVGWVPTDPTLGLWVLTPRHLAFADTVTETPEVRVVVRGDDGLAQLPRRRGLPYRPNAGSSLVCRLLGDGDPARAVAILYGRGGEVLQAVLEPEGRFDELLPGRWRLRVVADGTVLEDRTLDLAPARRHSFGIERRRARPAEEVGS